MTDAVTPSEELSKFTDNELIDELLRRGYKEVFCISRDRIKQIMADPLAEKRKDAVNGWIASTERIIYKRRERRGWYVGQEKPFDHTIKTE